MPRKRVSDEAPKERARLRSAEEVNIEIRKLYRRYANKDLSAADLKTRTAALTALRAGLSDPIEPADPAAGFRPGIAQLDIIGIPRGWAVAALYGREAHLPFETLHRLKELLPADAFEPLPDPSLPPPIDESRPPPLLVERDEPPLAPEVADITPALAYVPLPPRARRPD